MLWTYYLGSLAALFEVHLQSKIAYLYPQTPFHVPHDELLPALPSLLPAQLCSHVWIFPPWQGLPNLALLAWRLPDPL